MGQQRTDTNQQRAAKQRVADSRKCHVCGRRSAMSTRYELRDDLDRRIGSARTCNYCGAVRGVRNREPFREARQLPEGLSPALLTAWLAVDSALREFLRALDDERDDG